MTVFVILAVLALGILFLAFTKKSKKAEPTPAIVVNVPSVIPPIPAAPVDHSADTPKVADDVGTLVGQPVPNGGVPDQYGAAVYPAIARKFAPSATLLWIGALPYVAAKSAAAYSLVVNCSNMRMLGAWGTRQIRLDNYMPLVPVANAPSAVDLGVAAFHMAGNAYGEPKQYIPNCFAIPSDLDTWQKVLDFAALMPDYGTGYVGGVAAGGVNVGRGAQRPRIVP